MSHVTLLIFLCILYGAVHSCYLHACMLLHLQMLVQLVHNVLRHKYGVTTHFKLLHVRNADLAIKVFVVMQYLCCKIVVAMQKTAMATPVSVAASLEAAFVVVVGMERDAANTLS